MAYFAPVSPDYAQAMSAVETDTRVDERPDVLPTHDGDHERFAHYADRDKITEAMVTGTPVVALCGKVWVPTRDPKKYPICPECKRLFELGPDGRMRDWQRRNPES
jgi:hypothetical protein